MKIKKCMWCLKGFETDSKEKYCSIECKSKREDLPKKNVIKKGFFAVVVDLTASSFS